MDKTPLHPLQAARIRLNLTQKKLAELAKVSDQTIWRAEHNMYINPTSRLLLCEFFQQTSEDLGLVTEETRKTKSKERIAPVIDSQKADTLHIAPSTNKLGTHQLSETLLSRIMKLISECAGKIPSYSTLQTSIDKEIKAFEITEHPVINAEHHLSRRDAITLIASLPLSFSLHSFQSQTADAFDEDLLLSCAASITACWHLSKGNDLPVIEHVLSVYLQKLEALALQPSHYQKEIAKLASQGYQLANILAGHSLDIPARKRYCQQAVHYSKLAGDTNLLVASLTKLGTTYYYCHEQTLALKTYQEALLYVKDASPLLQSSLYAKLGIVYTQHGKEQDALTCIGMAQEAFPEHPETDPSSLYADYGFPSLCLWEGLTHLEREQPQYARLAFDRVASTKPTKMVSERNHIEIVNHQAEMALALGDLESYCFYLQAGRDGALQLRSEKRYQEAYGVFLQGKYIWGKEKKFRELTDLFVR